MSNLYKEQMPRKLAKCYPGYPPSTFISSSATVEPQALPVVLAMNEDIKTIVPFLVSSQLTRYAARE